jgi:hypothetical protein
MNACIRFCALLERNPLYNLWREKLQMELVEKNKAPFFDAIFL